VFADQSQARVLLLHDGEHSRCAFADKVVFAGKSVEIPVLKWTANKDDTEAELVFSSSLLPSNWQPQEVICKFELEGRSVEESPILFYLDTSPCFIVA